MILKFFFLALTLFMALQCVEVSALPHFSAQDIVDGLKSLVPECVSSCFQSTSNKSNSSGDVCDVSPSGAVTHHNPSVTVNKLVEKMFGNGESFES